MGDVFEFLKSTSVASVMLPIAEVYSVKPNDLVRDAYKILVEKNILSVPVIKNGVIIAFLDQIDILHLACENHDLKEATCAEACNHSKQSPLVTINSKVDLIKLCESFCISHPDLPRVAVVDDEGKAVGILTQSKLIKHFAPQVKHFDFGNATVEQLHLGHRKFQTVSENDTISHTIQQIYENKTVSAAIVDADGKLIGNFSASDLKFFGVNPQTQIEEMLAVKLKDFSINVNRPHKSPIFVHKTAPCHHVVHKLEKEKIHRVYVVDEDTKVLGVIINSDILGLFWRALLIC